MPMTDTNKPAIRVMVVDDHTLFRRGLTALLARDARVQIVGMSQTQAGPSAARKSCNLM